MTAEGIRLYDAQGRRKYLTPEERKAFLAVAERSPGKMDCAHEWNGVLS